MGGSTYSKPTMRALNALKNMEKTVVATLFQNVSYTQEELVDLSDRELYDFYNPARIAVVLDCGDEMITKQEFKDECEINNILRDFTRTGIIDHINRQEAAWLELPDQMDFQESLERIRSAEAAFDSLPSVVREKYGNNPAAFLGALTDPSQADYLREVGILAPKWVKSPDAGAPAPAAPSGAGASSSSST